MTRARSLSLLANSNIFTVDQSNSRVGIGSTIPDVKLDVDGDMNVTGTLTYEDVTNVETAGITTTGGLVVTGLGATIGGITTFFGDINFGAAGVGGTVTTLGHGGFTGIVTALGFEATGVITAASFRGDGSQLSGVDSSNLVDSGDTNRVAANTSGIVVTGIGTVNGNVFVRASSDPTIQIQSTDSSISADQAIGSIEFKANDGSNAGDQITGSIESVAQAAFTGQGSPSHLIFSTNGASGADALAERLRITHNGDILIAKTTTALTTQGGRISDGFITLSGDSNSTNLATNSGASLNLANIDSTDNNFSNIGGYNSNGLVVNQIDFINKSHSSRTGEIAFLTHNGSAMSERLRIDSSGRVLVGNTQDSSPFSWGIGLQVSGTSTNAGLSIRRDQNTSGGALLMFVKSRSGSLNGNTVVADGDQIGGMYFNAADGTDVNSYAAQIACEIDGAPAANDVPGRLKFSTTADGASAPTERLRITSTGRVGINVNNPDSYNSAGNNLVLGDTGNNSGMTIVTSTTNNGHIFFADGTASGSQNRGIIKYEHGNDAMAFNTAESERFRLGSSGQIGLGGANYGTAGQVITSNGSGSAPTWQDASGGGGISTQAGTASGIVTSMFLNDATDHKVTATGICTITTTQSGTEGQSHTIRIVNSGIATVGFSTYFLFPSGSAPVLPIADGAVSIISFTVHDSVGAGCTQLLAGASLNFS